MNKSVSKNVFQLSLMMCLALHIRHHTNSFRAFNQYLFHVNQLVKICSSRKILASKYLEKFGYYPTKTQSFTGSFHIVYEKKAMNFDLAILNIAQKGRSENGYLLSKKTIIFYPDSSILFLHQVKLHYFKRNRLINEFLHVNGF